jgi:hypothetical protein
MFSRRGEVEDEAGLALFLAAKFIKTPKITCIHLSNNSLYIFYPF